MKQLRDQLAHAVAFWKRPCLLRRGYHRRLREADEEFVLQAIRRLGLRGDLDEGVATTWDVFKSMPGQGHWSCPCAIEDGNASAR